MSNLRILVPMTGKKSAGRVELFACGVMLLAATLPALGRADLNSALDNFDLAFTSGGDASWYEQFVEYDPAGDGDAAASGTITHNQNSYIETYLEGPGKLLFSWKVGSWGCRPGICDALVFTMDGIIFAAIQSYREWHRVEIIIPPGVHLVRWTYQKDGADTQLPDRGWLDSVTYELLGTDEVDFSWDFGSPLPGPRCFHGVQELYGRILAVGGENGGNLDSLEEYDPVYNSWAYLSSMPVARSKVGAATARGNIYVAGGTDGASTYPYLYFNTPSSTIWSSLADMSAGRREFSLVNANGDIYAIGGHDSAYSVLSSVEQFSPSYGTWIGRASMNVMRGGLAAAAINNRIYAIGGYNGIDECVPTVEEYDPFSDNWVYKADMPTARKYLAAVAKDGRIYAIGGTDDFGAPLSVVEEFNPVTGEWRRCVDLPLPCYGMGAAVGGDGKVIVVGGFNGYPRAEVMRGTVLPTYLVWTPQMIYENRGGREPGQGEVIVAPNVLDRSVPDARVLIALRGKSFGVTECRIFGETGNYITKIHPIQMDADGFAVVEFDGMDEEGRRLGTGIYYAVVDGEGIQAKVPFAIVRRGRK